MIELTDEDRGDIQQPRRRNARFQISENVMFAVGVDRPTVEAFRHLLNKVGNTADTPSLPDTVIGLEALTAAPPAEPFIAPGDDLTPVVQMTEQIEFLQTEVRQLAEQVAVLSNLIADLQKGTIL